MQKRDAGFSSAGLVAGLSALGLTFLFVQNQNRLVNDKMKEAKTFESSLDKANLHLSNFSLLKAALQPAKRGKFHIPALYPVDYFAESWTLEENSDVKAKGMDMQGQQIKVNVLASSVIESHAIASKMKFSSKTPTEKADQTLKVYELKHDKTYPYWVEAVDVNSKIISSDKKSSTANGRVHLDAPVPQDLKIAIKAPGASDFKIYTKDDNLPEMNNPSGKYVFRILGSGVVLYGELIVDGTVHPFGMDGAGKITHPARNIKAVDKIIGELEIPIEAKTVTSTSTSTGSGSSGSGGSEGSGSSGGSGGGDAACKIGADNAYEFSQGIGTVDGAASSGTGATASTTTTTTTTTTPVEVSIAVKLYGVDGQEATDISFKKSFTVGSKESKVASTTTPGTTGTSDNKGHNNCSEWCPINSVDSFDNNIDSQAMILDRAALAEPDTKKTDLYNPIRTANSLDTSTIPGIICDNYDLAGKSMYVTSGLLASVMLKQNKGQYQSSFEKYKSMYQSYIFIAPKCNRTVINDRTTCGCFAEDTPILMGDGSEKAIRDLRQSDLVWNPKAQKIQSIAKVIRGPENIPMYEISVAGKKLSVTQDHPFLTELGLAPARLLEMKQKIDIGGEWRAIESIALLPVPEELPIVWNISLEGSEDEADHFVLAGGVMTGDLYIQEKLKLSAP